MTIETETTSCLICGANEYEPRFHLHDWAYELPGEFQVVRCLRCAHLYQNPRPTQAAIEPYYPRDYQPFWPAIDDDPRPWWRALGHWRWRTRCRQVTQLRQGGSLLDVGASTGVFLNEMRRYGAWNLTGVELSGEAAQYARDKFALEVFTGQIEEVGWPAQTFDVITCWDVIEHLPQPQIALHKMRYLLKDDGYLIMSVPNGGSLDAKLFGRYWIGLDQPRHMSIFNLAGLQRLLESSGFEIERAYCFYGRYTTFALSCQIWLHAHARPSKLRRVLERGLFLPVWRYLTLPYFWLLDHMRRGAIIAIRARPR
jgi:SAM-dependent methyltransferase